MMSYCANCGKESFIVLKHIDGKVFCKDCYEKYVKSQREDVLRFIKMMNQHNVREFFIDGYCYHFTSILKDIYNGERYYSKEKGHFLIKLYDCFYDIDGEQVVEDTYIKWSELKLKDPILTTRIYRDCVYKRSQNYE